MRLFGKKPDADTVKQAARFKTFFTTAKVLKTAYPDSTAPFPSAEMAKARSTLKRDDVRDALDKLKVWNDGLPEPAPKLNETIVQLTPLL